MNKKVLSLVLALAIVLGSFGTVQATSTTEAYTSQDAKIQWLIDNEHVEGRLVNEDESPDLALESNVTRAEITKLLVHILGKADLAEVLQGVMRPFPDVTIDHWANGFISVATTHDLGDNNDNRIVIGYPDGNFYPENNVTYAELATMLVRIVKDDLTTRMEADSIWATSYMRWAEEEGILDGLTITNSDAPANRADAFEMIYNAFFKMGGINEVDFGADLGIVSKLGNGEIQLNQDADKVYKIDANTMLTDGTTWRSLLANLDAPLRGSLVRLIVEDGVVTHLIELGNPRDLALDASRWFGVANRVAEGTATFDVVNRRYVDVQIDGHNLEINNSTRIFVSDVNNNALTEVDSVAEAFNLMQIDDRVANRVYAGFDGRDGQIKTAKVIVFTQIENYFGEKATVRVTGDLNSALRFEGENTKGVKTVYNVSNLPLFPSTDLLDPMDVVEITDNTNIQDRNDLIKIDYSEDNIYEVVRYADRLLTLKDVDGYQVQFNVSRDVLTFLEGQVRAGSKVQIDNEGALVEIISVLDANTALRGTLENGVYVGTNNGWKFASIAEDGTVRVYITDPANGRPIERTFYIPETNRAQYGSIAAGGKFTFDVSDWYGGVPVMTNIKAALPVPTEQSALNAQFVEAVQALPGQTRITNDRYETSEKVAALRAEIEAAKALYANADENDATVQAWLGTLDAQIEAFNALDLVVAPAEPLDPIVPVEPVA